MIDDPIGILTVLLVIEGAILLLCDYHQTRRFFDVMPPMFWIYFLPMMANTVGLITPEKNEQGQCVTLAYQSIIDNCLPASLVLLLISVDIRAIARLGRVALLVMLAGSAGIVLGGPVVLMIFRPFLPEDIWKGFAALSASWTGGSANMLAVAKGLDTPDSIYLPMVVVDTIVPYVWMGLLILLASRQKLYDRWNRSQGDALDHLARRMLVDGPEARPITLRHLVLMFALGALATVVSMKVGAVLPEAPKMINAYAWTIITATTLGVILSFTPVRQLESYGASRVGYALLYLVLAAIGARANLSHLKAAPLLLAAGFVWVAIHAACIILAGRLLRAPMALIATASQANIGGVASTPVVAEAYRRGLAPVGLLLAVFGNIIGTYLGFLCGTLCRIVSEW
jgi:uncharacterized membrane protein